MKFSMIHALFKRDFLRYLSSPTGYVFITVFILLSAYSAFWQEGFFLHNLANLNQLNMAFPYLLLFFIPALTMGTWAEEKKLGTEELLLTLPASNLEVVLGKFLSVLGVYTISLAFASSHIIALAQLGSPDAGLMAANYLGYWLAGMALISVGMLASLMTSNVSIGFILGALFCAILVLIGQIDRLGFAAGEPARIAQNFGIVKHFDNFGKGVIRLDDIIYFLSITCLMLYSNMVLLKKRHVSTHRVFGQWTHHAIRFVSLMVILTSLGIFAEKTALRQDMTAEKLHSLSDETHRLLVDLDKENPVLIEAFISKEVPPELVQTRLDMLNLLEEYDTLAKGAIQVIIHETEPYSDEAQDAQQRFDIQPYEFFSYQGGQQSVFQVFLGAVFTCRTDEIVIPFMHSGLPVEYELTRAIRVTSRKTRKKVGILVTDAELFGGFDFQTYRSNPEWSIVTELKNQYQAQRVSPDEAAVPEDLDVLVAALPSSLTQPQMDNLANMIRSGLPTLLLVDPLPMINPNLSPNLPKPPPPGGNMFGGGQQPEPKGDISALMKLIGVQWPQNRIVWDHYNPHPTYEELPPEFIFIGPGNGSSAPINPENTITSGLQELVLLYPGHLRAIHKNDFFFTPLLRTGPLSGVHAWSTLIEQGFMGMTGFNPNPPYFQSPVEYIVAARIQGTLFTKEKEAQTSVSDKDVALLNTRKSKIDVIAIADLDVISEQFFNLRRQGVAGLDFDNVTFILNAVDVLAGDELFVSLRKRRPVHRTLTALEEKVQSFRDEQQKQAEVAEEAAKQRLAEVQAILDKKVEAIRSRMDLDQRTREIMLATVEQDENRKFEVQKTHIENTKQDSIRKSEIQLKRSIRHEQRNIKLLAVMLPPVPAFLLGLAIFLMRFLREKAAIAPDRRLRTKA